MAADRPAATLTVVYYALLRDRAGRDRESLPVAAGDTARSLYQQLSRRYDFELAEDRLQVAVNKEFVPWERELAPGDEVVFIPPVAGGAG